MNKKKEIVEMAQVYCPFVGDCKTCDDFLKLGNPIKVRCIFLDFAEALYNNNYRRVEENNEEKE